MSETNVALKEGASQEQEWRKPTTRKVNGGGTLTYVDIEDRYIRRQLDKIARYGRSSRVIACEGEMASVLGALAMLSASRRELTFLRRRHKAVRSEVKLSELAEFDDFLDSIYSDVNRIRKKYERLWKRVKKVLDAERAPQEKEGKTKTQHAEDGEGEEVVQL